VFDQPEAALVRYEDLRGLTAPGRRAGEDFPIHVYHAGGVVRVPPGLSEPSAELYDFLLGRLPPLAGPDPDTVPAKLRDFVAGQVGLFGPEKVFVFRARPFPPPSLYRRHVWYSLAVAAAGAAWVAAGVVIGTADAKGGGPWAGCGVLLLLLGLLFAFLFSRSGGGRVSDWHESCLVVSPGGIALLQGALRGKMRWDELRSIEYPAKRRFGLSSAGSPAQGVGLLVEGAYLVIADYYDRPLYQIHRCLVAYWDGQDAT
jgi:hypothetical protein